MTIMVVCGALLIVVAIYAEYRTRKQIRENEAEMDRVLGKED